jgi:O-antigen/teichoic acid export membrane protein
VTEQKSSYRQIFKATSLFGGVQVANILIGMVRVKFVAVFLGTAGVGIIGLLDAPLRIITAITGMGISFSAVRDISEAHGSGDQNNIAKAIITLRRWSWFTGVLGAVAVIALAPSLSQWSFGNKDYTWAFVWLSVTLLLTAISKGQSAILQGTRRLKHMAKASVYGSLIGLFTSVPLYYYFGTDGIVPAMIITAVTGLLLSWYFSRKVQIQKIVFSIKESFYSGKSMIKLGMVMSFTGLIGNFTSYILVAFISRTGGIDQVGLYNSGWSIVGQYTGLVFMAMLTDYYPRLAAVNKDNAKARTLINQQAEMVALILGPILIILIIAMPLIIRILYTPAFLPIVIFVNWAVFGIVLKGIVWPIGFLFPAKGDVKLFAIIEITALIFNLGNNILGYYLWGLEGLGISFIVNYLFGFTLSYILANKKYEFFYKLSTIRLFLVTIILILTVFTSAYFMGHPFTYIFGSIIFLISLSYSLVSLQSRMDFLRVIRNFFKPKQ